jgi:hypothetical protein
MYDRLKSLLGISSTSSAPAALSLRSIPVAESVPNSQPEAASQPPEKITCQESRQSVRTGVSFVVDDVVATQNQFPATTLRENLELRSGASIIILPDQNKPSLVPGGFFRETSHRHYADRHCFVHPLMEAVHLSFSQHRPLVLSPDCIWLTIVQGFTQHLHEHAESFRGRIVAHAGKKDLTVQTESLDEKHWPEFISQFSEQIRRNSDPILYETLICNFSTTTPTCAPLKVQVADSSQSLDLVLMAGFFVVTEDPENLSLSPEIAWGLVNRDPRAGSTGGNDQGFLKDLEKYRLEKLKTKNRVV